MTVNPEEIEATSWEQECQRCGKKLYDHVVYLETMDLPPHAVEGSFASEVAGFYCPPESAPIWEDVETNAEFL